MRLVVLYADDLVITAESEVEVDRKFCVRKRERWKLRD